MDLNLLCIAHKNTRALKLLASTLALAAPCDAMLWSSFNLSCLVLPSVTYPQKPMRVGDSAFNAAKEMSTSGRMTGYAVRQDVLVYRGHMLSRWTG